MIKKNTKVSRILMICISILLILGLVYFFLIRGHDNSQYIEEPVKRQTIETHYTFTGNVESMDSQTAISTSNLSVKTFHVKEGDDVKPGDILYVLDDKAILSSVEQATASLEIAKINYENAQGLNKDQQTTQINNTLASSKLSYNNALNAYKTASDAYERMLSLYEAGGISKVDLDNAGNALNTAKSGLDSAEIAQNAAQKNYNNLSLSITQSVRTAAEQLNQTQAAYDNVMRQKNDLTVKAEISGEVSEIHVSENESLAMGTRIMDIVDYDNLKISIRVDEYDLPAVTIGKDARVSINALDMEVQGVVESIAREAIPLANISYFPASVKIASNDLIRVGLGAEVKVLNKKSENTLTVPMRAVRFDQDNQTFVYRKDARGKAETNYITVGINDANTVEVLDGLREGDIVLIPVSNFQMVRPFRAGGAVGGTSGPGLGGR